MCCCRRRAFCWAYLSAGCSCNRIWTVKMGLLFRRSCLHRPEVAADALVNGRIRDCFGLREAAGELKLVGTCGLACNVKRATRLWSSAANCRREPADCRKPVNVNKFSNRAFRKSAACSLRPKLANSSSLISEQYGACAQPYTCFPRSSLVRLSVC